MLLYNWKKIYKVSGGNVIDVFNIFEMLVKKSIPRHRNDTLYRWKPQYFHGTSFLLHADVLLFNSYKHSYKEIASYIAVASYRSIAEYSATKTTTLNLLHLPFAEFLVANIDKNSLLRIDDDNIVHFLYEEAPTEIH